MNYIVTRRSVVNLRLRSAIYGCSRIVAPPSNSNTISLATDAFAFYLVLFTFIYLYMYWLILLRFKSIAIQYFSLNFHRFHSLSNFSNPEYRRVSFVNWYLKTVNIIAFPSIRRVGLTPVIRNADKSQRISLKSSIVKKKKTLIPLLQDYKSVM